MLNTGERRGCIGGRRRTDVTYGERNDMIDIETRGGLPLDAPLELTGEFTGFNNGPTMRVGLWIRNDSEHVAMAHSVAVEHGPKALGVRLSRLIGDAFHNGTSLAAAGVWQALDYGNHLGCVDWAQIAYDLIGEEPDEAELAEAVEAGARQGLTVTESGAWKLALLTRQKRVRRWVLEGVR